MPPMPPTLRHQEWCGTWGYLWCTTCCRYTKATPTLSTLHSTLFTLHFTLYPLHSTPCTLHSQLSTLTPYPGVVWDVGLSLAHHMLQIHQGNPQPTIK
jgi:hypothetical protein